MDKKRLNRIFLFTAAGMFILLGVVALARALRPDEPTEEIVVLAQPQTEIVDVQAVELSPSPSPEPQAYEGTVTLLVDRVPVLTLRSEYEAKAILWNYLSLCAVAPEGERLVSARFDCELILAEADPYVEPVDDAHALAILQNAPDVVPVRVVTERVEYASGTATYSESTDDALAKGCRIFVQLGAGARTETRTEIAYRGGEIAETGTPASRTILEARDTIVRVGGFAPKSGKGDPGRLDGPEGKDAGDLVLVAPMRGQLTSYFGFHDGEMANGVEITNKVGTSVTAPGEGLIVYCGERGAYGFVVDINHGNGFVSRITHLADVVVEFNQRVFAGDAIGVLAEPDGDQRPNLHYELLIDGVPYNPLHYFS